MDAVEALTPVVQDYLKVIWSATEWGDPPITTKRLAERFATTQANVSDTMRRLQAQGLVEYTPYRPVRLTPLGAELAIAMVRRHRLIETFLAETLGYAWDEVHDEAERLEHAASASFLDRIDRLLGHPRYDPHGDQIPGPAGEWVPPTGVERLSDAAPGRYRIIRVADSDPERLARFARHGLVPHQPVEVLSSPGASKEVAVAGQRIALQPEDCDVVRVRAERAG
ncbi:metal-dependent transcriptional regulator [Propionicicella superfundia]|uniref:metal-dependent transcriptional regulator n=1 Tax=Propionicicella superfundia TaxID=348582 RepID=UPI0004195028|nr:metal-dependent transcriptional regulator [Propionicicella superfundia]